ncbi:MAG TPA: hypothetical protein VLA33_01690 [Gemmatimonadota bacterium]|nr:hypothetical protein [Gemmatimonadota bacterium]
MNISSTASSIGWERTIRSRRVANRAFALAALALGFSPAGAGAQDPNLVDQGRYDVRLGDSATGTETFAIRRQGEGYMAVGRIQLEGSGAWLRSAEIWLRTDGSFTPVRYRLESLVTGDPRTVDFLRSGTRIRISTSSDEGVRVNELLADPDHVLLEPGLAQHYYFVVRRLTAGGDRLTAVIPGEGREAPVRVAGTSNVTIEIGERSVDARRWELTVDGMTHLVWSDRSDGRILRVEIPDRGWRSDRRADE